MEAHPITYRGVPVQEQRTYAVTRTIYEFRARLVYERSMEEMESAPGLNPRYTADWTETKMIPTRHPDRSTALRRIKAQIDSNNPS